jgi:hypothetical protein
MPKLINLASMKISQSMEIFYKTNFFSDKTKIEFLEDKIKLSSGTINLYAIDKHKLNAIRFGIKWISGLEFTIGRLYCIDLKGEDGEILKIRLRTIYGINRKNLHKKYTTILNQLFDYQFSDLISQKVSNIESGNTEEISELVFDVKGIHLKTLNIDNLITWHDINLRAYSYYYTINSQSNPNNYIAKTFLTDWNSWISFAVIEQILKNKELKN